MAACMAICSHTLLRSRASSLPQESHQWCRYTGKGRVVLFANNPIYRWQNHGEFNMVFNTLLNWNDMSDGARAKTGTEATNQPRQ